MSRVLYERYIIASKDKGVFPANQAVYVEQGDYYGLNPNIQDGDIVIYDADKKVTVGAGVTASQVPNLVIAQAIETPEGIVLRKSAGGKISSCNLNAVTAEPPTCGQIKIVDVGIGCVEKGNSYSLTIEVRDDEVERFYDYRNYRRFTETVEFDYDTCAGCDQPLSCKEVACALANKFNGTDRKAPLTKNLSLLRRVREHQDKDKPFHVYVLHPHDYEFCFTTASEACVGCNRIDAVTGVTVGGVTTSFLGTVDPTNDEKTLVSQVDKLIKFINIALGDKGYALNASTFSGSAKPCCDGVKILINSCEVVSLLGFGGAAITPCAEEFPVDNVVVNGHCGGCSTSTTVSPCAYLRVVPKPIKLEKFCDRPDAYKKTLYTDIRVTSSYNHNKFGFFREFVRQDYKIPSGLVYELVHTVKNQDTSYNEPFSYGYDEYTSTMGFQQGSRTPAMLKGLLAACDNFDTVCIYNFEHDLATKDTAVAARPSDVHLRTVVAVPSSNTAFKTEFEGIINPWLTSIGGCNKLMTVTCSSDQDQVEEILNPDYTINQAEYPNSNGKIVAG
jgi:hypothetical protein